MSDRETAGIIGLGNMGGAVASALVAAGGRVVVYDLDEARVAQLVQEGAVAGGSARTSPPVVRDERTLCPTSASGYDCLTGDPVIRRAVGKEAVVRWTNPLIILPS